MGVFVVLSQNRSGLLCVFRVPAAGLAALSLVDL